MIAGTAMSGAGRPHRSVFAREVPSAGEGEGEVSVCGVVVELRAPDTELHSNRPLVISLGQPVLDTRHSTLPACSYFARCLKE